jgi:hypothetical protein
VRTYEDTFNGKQGIYESFYQRLTCWLEFITSLEPHGRNPRRDRIKERYKESFEWLWDQSKSGPGFLDWLQGDDPLSGSQESQVQRSQPL